MKHEDNMGGMHDTNECACQLCEDITGKPLILRKHPEADSIVNMLPGIVRLYYEEDVKPAFGVHEEIVMAREVLRLQKENQKFTKALDRIAGLPYSQTASCAADAGEQAISIAEKVLK